MNAQEYAKFLVEEFPDEIIAVVGEIAAREGSQALIKKALENIGRWSELPVPTIDQNASVMGDITAVIALVILAAIGEKPGGDK